VRELSDETEFDQHKEQARLLAITEGRRPGPRDYVGFNMRPAIDVGDPDDRPLAVDEAVEALVRLNDFLDPYPEAYLQGNIATRVTSYEGRTRLEFVRKQSLVELLGQAATFIVTSETQAGEMRVKHVAPPAWLAQTILERRPADLPGVPQIERVVDVPTFGPDEGADTVVQRAPGYSADTRAFLEPAPDIADRLHLLPTGREEDFDPSDLTAALERSAEMAEVGGVMVNAETRAAVLTLLHPFSDFPFADAASGVNFLAMVIEPFVRTIIGGDHPTPMYVFKASTPGTGKSLLCQAGLYVGCGSVPPATYHADPVEFDKRLMAYVLTGPTAVLLDNVNDPVDSATLAAMLTATEWRGRVIGTSQVPEVRFRHVWALTANNPSMSREITRRTVPIVLDYDGDPTARRDFEVPDLMGYVRDHRIELIGAVHTLVHNWLRGGGGDTDHEGNTVRHVRESAFLASYDRWAGVLGGILGAAGLPHFLENLDEWSGAASPDEEEFAGLLAAWHERRTGPVTARGLVELLGGVGGDGLLPVEMPAAVRASRHKDDASALVYLVLRPRQGAHIGGYRIVRAGTAHGGAALWDVERLG
jgi:hypothetical protein